MLPGSLRVLFVYRFCGLGGVETSIVTKVKAMRAAGVDAQALLLERYGVGGESLAAQEGVRIDVERHEIRPFLRQGFDAVIVVDYPQLIPVIEAARVSSTVFFETHSSLPDDVAHFVERLASPRVAALVAPSQFNWRLLEAGGITRKPFAIIPNPVDTGVFRRLSREALRDRFGNRLETTVLLWVGRLEEEKNPVEMLRIAGEMCDRDPSIHLIMVGDSPE